MNAYYKALEAHIGSITVGDEYGDWDDADWGDDVEDCCCGDCDDEDYDDEDWDF